MSAGVYQPLPGRSKPAWGLLWLLDVVFLAGQCGVAATHRLYLASDHLLLVEHKLFSETVRRYYLRDIQAISVQQTRSHQLVNLTLVLLLLGVPAFAAFRLSQEMNIAGIVAAGLTAALLLVLLAINLWLGPTCQTELVTDVDRQSLGGLRRWRSASAFARRIESLAREAQAGTMGLDAATPVAWTAAVHSDPPAMLRRSRPEGTPEFRLPRSFFLLLLLCSASSALDTLFVNYFKNAFDALLYSGALLCGSLALGNVRKYEGLVDLRNLLGVALSVLVVFFYVAQAVLGMEMAFQVNPEDPTAMYQPPTEVTPFLFGYSVLSAVVYGVLGFLGLYEVGRGQNRSAREVNTGQQAGD